MIIQASTYYVPNQAKYGGVGGSIKFLDVIADMPTKRTDVRCKNIGPPPPQKKKKNIYIYIYIKARWL